MKKITDFESATMDDIIRWAEPQTWAKQMAVCGQDALWHAEGDVWTHTKLVLRQLEKLDDWNQLDRVSQLKLIFTALFHDSGKPATTIIEPETGRTRSPKHAIAGMEIARSILRSINCGLAFREEVANLVRYHGRPAFVLEKQQPAKDVITLSLTQNLHLLYLFALADTRGRDTADNSKPEEHLHLWKMVAEENLCFDKPYPFVNDHARFLFCRDQLSSLHYSPREEYRCNVTMLSGLPGAGKDTWLKQNKSQLPVVSLDDIRKENDIDPTDNQGEVVQMAREKCREYLRAKKDFAFNATNTLRQTRQRWIDLFAEYDARIEIVYIEPNLSTVYNQNAKRQNQVPERVIDRLIERLEPPTLCEAHALKLVG